MAVDVLQLCKKVVAQHSSKCKPLPLARPSAHGLALTEI
jgi:hypothetical protein